MKVYDLKIRTKKDYRFKSTIEAKDFEDAKEIVNDALLNNSFIYCNTDDEDAVFLAVSEIAHLVIINDKEVSE